LDINGVIDYLKNLGYEEIILQGHSLGPHKICYYLANSPKYKIDRIILLTTADIRYQFNSAVPHWEEYSGVAKQMVDDGRGDMLMPVKLWSHAPISAKSFLHYTNPDSNAWVFNFTSPEVEFRNFNKLKQKMLIVVPENDIATGIAQEKAMTMLKEKSLSKDFESYIIENAVHNFASKEEQLVKVIVDWLVKK
jgi:pimeloyl-ACP methyl ester carboxylesterase